MDDLLKNEIKIAFENTVLSARTNSPSEAYEYGYRMSQYVIRLIERKIINKTFGSLE